ncbi:hypothetical protein SpCBS45565_g05557 [Spizellomyces sp. 'palustris']|nr:hypothetical protein SpCBS45565_g05557 [Spizellomyces sp. 'palustris']
MEESLERAVAVSVDPTANVALKTEAMAFCDQVRNSSNGWQVCLKIFIKVPKSSEHTRFFALHVLEDVLRRRYAGLNPNERAGLRQALWNWLVHNLDESEFVYMRNKFIQIVVLMFAAQYPGEWPSFFDDLLSLLSSTSGTQRNSIMIDTFLRVSLAIDDEVANLMISRDAKETARNTQIKDVMRENAVARLVSAWGDILMGSYQSDAGIANMCLRLFARYVAWIDINLVVNEAFISGLYQFLGVESLRLAACECLTEIVGKGMKPVDKLSLIRALDITNVLGSLPSDDAEFAEYVARLVNSLGLELCKCWEMQDIRESSFQLLQQIFPYLIQFLANEYDDTSSVLFPYLQAYTDVLKQYIKLGGQGSAKPLEENLIALLRTVVLKMKYDEGEEHEFGQQAGELDALFMELRQNLKKHFNAIATIDEPVFVNYILSVVTDTFGKIARSPGSVSWSEAELSLHLVYLLGESVKVQFAVGEPPAAVITPLGQMLTKMITSNVSAYPHVSIPLIFFENVTRYSQFFDLFPQYIPNVMEAFVDQRGMHHDAPFVRSRTYYLFRQYVQSLKGKLSPLVNNVLASIEDLMVVQLPEPKKPVRDGEEEVTATSFDSQLYLYEAVGILISLDGMTTEKQAQLLTVVLTPLMRQIEEIMRNELYRRDTPDNIVFTLQLDHLIRAIGNISKGFPDVDQASKVVQTVPAWALVFQQALGAIVAVLERLHESELIRNAVRIYFPFYSEIDLTPVRVAGLLSNSTRQELVDFVPFIGHITHKFKPAVFPIMNELIGPLMDRIFSSLNQPVDGTDDAFSLLELRKAYLNLLATIFNADMEGTLVTEANMPRLATVVQSVLHFVKESGDRTSQKLAFSVLTKMVLSWGASEDTQINGIDPKTYKKGIPGAKSDKAKHTTQPKPPLPGFEQFIYENIVPILFEVPMNASFNPSDGQCYLVMSEISSLQKTLVSAQGAKYLEYLVSVYLPSIGCPPNAAQEFVAALQRTDVKELRIFLQVGQRGVPPPKHYGL